MSLLKYIGKATDSDLVEMLTAKFENMSKTANIKQFYGYESSVLGLLEKLRSGSERSTWRSWFGGIWKYIEMVKKEKGTMMSVLKEADKCGSWYEKLEVYSDGSKIDDELISSRWTSKVREAARKALDHIKDIIKLPDTGKKEDKDKACDSNKQGHVVHILRDVFSYKGSSLEVKLGGKEYEKEGNKLGNKTPLLPAKRESLTGEYVEVAFTDCLRAVFELGDKRIEMTKKDDSIIISQNQ